MELRGERLGDEDAVRHVHLRAFGDHGEVVADLVDVWVLSPLGVLPKLQRQGIGSALVRAGLATLTEGESPLVFLEGDPGYYSRFGFTPGAELGFRKPSLRIPDAAFQVIRLPAYEPWTGTLVYSEPFWRHDAVGLRDLDA